MVGKYQYLMKAAKGVKSCQKDNHDNDVFAKTRALLILEEEEEHEVDRRHQEACSRALAESRSHFEAFGGKNVTGSKGEGYNLFGLSVEAITRWGSKWGLL